MDIIPNQLLIATASAANIGPSLNGFDIRTLIGVSGTPQIEAIVQFLKDEWALPRKLAPFASIVIGVLLNILLAMVLMNDVLSAVYTGIFTGLLSSVWHEARSV